MVTVHRRMPARQADLLLNGLIEGIFLQGLLIGDQGLVVLLQLLIADAKLDLEARLRCAQQEMRRPLAASCRAGQQARGECRGCTPAGWTNRSTAEDASARPERRAARGSHRE